MSAADLMAPWAGLQVDLGAIIRAARVHHVKVPVRPLLHLAGRTIADRSYLIVEIELGSGEVGTGYALTRGQPLGAHARDILPTLVGGPLAAVLQPGAGTRSPPGRVRALLDACGWDLLGVLTGRPVWSLLQEITGSAALARPALAVAGYRRGDESDGAFAARLRAASARYRALKLAPSTSTGTDLNGVLRVLAEEDEGSGLVVDFGCAFDRVEDALAAVRSLPPIRLDWIEDPFPPPSHERTAALRAHYGGKIGAGDEQSGEELHALVLADAVDVLRLDYTTAGGISGVLRALAGKCIRASFHVYPEVHRHLAAIFAEEIEMFPPGDAFDFSDRLFESELAVGVDGSVGLSQRPGLGLRFLPAAAEDLGGRIESLEYVG